MQIYVDPKTIKSSDIQMVIEHQGEEIYFYISTLDKKRFSDGDTVSHINSYLARLSPAVQQNIFQSYTDIKSVMEETPDTTQLIGELIPLVSNLYKDIKLEELEQWISFHSDIIIPSKLEDDYIDSDEKIGSREKTYLREDYKKLIALGLALRLMIPIWGEFIYVTRRETGTDFKEFYAVKLIARTSLMHSESMEKLLTYVTRNIKNDKPMYSNIINSIGSEEFPMWLTSQVLVRRLCIGDFTGLNTESSLVHYIFNFISQKVNGAPPSSLSSMVNGKEFMRGGDDENNVSRLEGYKIKQTIAPGDIVIIEHYLSDPYKVARKINPNVDINLLNVFLENTQHLNKEKISTCQIVLAQYVLKNVINPRGLMNVSKVHAMNAIAIAQTLLWDKYKQIAGIMSGKIINANNEIFTSGIDSKARIPKELMDELLKVFPYTRVSISKRKGKINNAALIAIDDLAADLSRCDWLLTLPDNMIESITGQKNTKRYTCPADIKIILARLILDIVTPAKV